MPGSARSDAESLGKRPPKSESDALRRGVQVSGAGIVAEALPQLEHLVLVRVREICDSRESLEESRVIARDGLCARLLEHDFGQPDAIGIARAAPRKVAPLNVVPVEQKFIQFHDSSQRCQKAFENS